MQKSTQPAGVWDSCRIIVAIAAHPGTLPVRPVAAGGGEQNGTASKALPVAGLRNATARHPDLLANLCPGPGARSGGWTVKWRLRARPGRRPGRRTGPFGIRPRGTREISADPGTSAFAVYAAASAHARWTSRISALVGWAVREPINRAAMRVRRRAVSMSANDGSVSTDTTAHGHAGQ
jgi:hypothetical protein